MAAKSNSGTLAREQRRAQGDSAKNARAERPARKGTARTARPAANSGVKSRPMTKAEQASGAAKLSKPTPTRAPKPKATAKTAAKPDPKAPRAEVIAKVRALRAKGMKWNAIAEETGMTMAALARVRATGKKQNLWL